MLCGSHKCQITLNWFCSYNNIVSKLLGSNEQFFSLSKAKGVNLDSKYSTFLWQTSRLTKFRHQNQIMVQKKFLSFKSDYSENIATFFFPQYPFSAVGEKLQMSVQSKPIFRSVTVLDEELMPQSNIKMCWYISEAEYSSQWDIICAILSRISVSCTTLTHRSIRASSLSPTLPRRKV